MLIPKKEEKYNKNKNLRIFKKKYFIFNLYYLFFWISPDFDK